MNHALRPVLLAVADFGVGGLLYQQVSEFLGVVLVIAGMLILGRVLYQALIHGGSVLWRRIQRASVSRT